MTPPLARERVVPQPIPFPVQPATPEAPALHVVTSSPARGAIRLAGVGVTLGSAAKKVEAVGGVDLHIAPGEFVSIVGPSGCGKSTLLNVVAGFVRQTAGTVELDGQAIVKPGPERGVVFQQYSLFPWLSVRGNVEYGLRVQGIARAERREISDDLLARCGLLSFADHFPEQLSGGMRQRVGIVRALANKPQVLLLDEPFGALDAQTRSVMQEILLDIWARFRTSVLFITHDIEESVFLSDRVYVMTARPGRIKSELVIDLPRPRTHEQLESPEAMRLVRSLRAEIREESLKAMGAELPSGLLGH
jgi:NitT/TauT family transport system ATP-binding protein